MSFFAIAAQPLENFRIAGCHFNLWCLPHKFLSLTFWRACFCRPYMFCDVGLRIVAKSEVKGLRILLPFQTAGNAFCDLSELVLAPETAPLIFGREVAFLAGQTIQYDGSSVYEDAIKEEVLTLPKECAKLMNDQSGTSFSAWQLTFRRPLSEGEKIYLRVRFSIKEPGDAWVSRGWGYAKRGALIDLRICDVREAAEVPQWEALKESIKPIEKLNLFLIVSAQQFARLCSPSFYYLRLLEHSVWEKYIAHGHGKKPIDKLSIYQWRGPVSSSGSSKLDATTESISIDKPFRLFVDLYQDFGPQLLMIYVLGIVTPTLLGVILKWLFE